MKMYPCDNLPCMNEIPEDEYKKALEQIDFSDGAIHLIFCGHCEDSPPPDPFLRQIMDSPIEEIIEALSDGCSATPVDTNL